MTDISVGHHVERPGFWARVGKFLVEASSSNARIRKVEQLNAMSDERLAKIGIRREDIVRHVFRDVL